MSAHWSKRSALKRRTVIFTIYYQSSNIVDRYVCFGNFELVSWLDLITTACTKIITQSSKPFESFVYWLTSVYSVAFSWAVVITSDINLFEFLRRFLLLISFHFNFFLQTTQMQIYTRRTEFMGQKQITNIKKYAHTLELCTNLTMKRKTFERIAYCSCHWMKQRTKVNSLFKVLRAFSTKSRICVLWLMHYNTFAKRTNKFDTHVVSSIIWTTFSIAKR